MRPNFGRWSKIYPLVSRDWQYLFCKSSHKLFGLSQFLSSNPTVYSIGSSPRKCWRELDCLASMPQCSLQVMFVLESIFGKEICCWEGSAQVPTILVKIAYEISFVQNISYITCKKTMLDQVKQAATGDCREPLEVVYNLMQDSPVNHNNIFLDYLPCTVGLEDKNRL